MSRYAVVGGCLGLFGLGYLVDLGESQKAGAIRTSCLRYAMPLQDGVHESPSLDIGLEGFPVGLALFALHPTI